MNLSFYYLPYDGKIETNFFFQKEANAFSAIHPTISPFWSPWERVSTTAAMTLEPFKLSSEFTDWTLTTSEEWISWQHC